MKYLVAIAACLSLACHSFGQRDPNPSVPTSSYGRALIRKPSIQAMRDYLSITNGGGGTGGAVVAGSGISVVTNGGGESYTVSATGGGGGSVALDTLLTSVWVEDVVVDTNGVAASFVADGSGYLLIFSSDTRMGTNGTTFDGCSIEGSIAFTDLFGQKKTNLLFSANPHNGIYESYHFGVSQGFETPSQGVGRVSGVVEFHPARGSTVYYTNKFSASLASGGSDVSRGTNYTRISVLSSTNGAGGIGSSFDGNITNGTARGYLQFVDGVTIGAKITPTNSFFDTGNNLAVGTNNASGAALNVEGTARFASVQLRDQQHYSKIGSGTHLLLKPELHNGIEPIYYWGGTTLNAQAWTVGSYEEGLTNGRFSFLVGELGISWNIGRSTNAAGDVGYLAATPSTNVAAFMSGATGPELRAAVSYRRDDDRNLFGGSSRGTTITGTNVIISVGTSTVTLSSNGITSTVPFPANQAAIGAIQYNGGGNLGASSSFVFGSAGVVTLGESGVSGVLKLYDVTYDDWSVLSGDSGVIEVTAATPAVLKADGGFKIASVTITSGSGSPESVVTAPVGSLFLRTDGSTSTTLYVKTSGAGNTGWTAK